MTREEMAREQRPALVVFTQSTLLLESLATFFATLVTWGLSRADVVDVSGGAVWVAGSALAAAFAFASGRANTRWGRILGWILHAPLIAGGLWVGAIAFVGIMFLGVYALGVRLGARIDRERAEHAGHGATQEGTS
ncbi:DUF4233 domain-containing protein [Demequina sp.]|uniref:DUF4233 domain-containing protein n=1 Tax=Demequina sp. TaxID=2050685 RepID=UPI0025BB1311|nr:DUF4233 domain-containing protein [Demequina sp.]